MNRLALPGALLGALALASASCSKSAGGPGAGGSGGTGAGGGGASSLIQLGTPGEDPASCEEAAAGHTYAGCDFWPTVTLNPVWSIFDFAVVVANVGSTPASVQVTGAQGMLAAVTVQPVSVAVIPLPWVRALKGQDFDACANSPSLTASLSAKRAAFHLTSDAPVIAYQFNALEYAGSSGPLAHDQSKDWSSCPGLQTCTTSGTPYQAGCWSWSNDASILLPTTALTGNYRVPALEDAGDNRFFAITGTADGTTVKVALGKLASVLPGGGLGATSPGQIVTLSLDAGDVVELVSDGTGDLGGSLVEADKPVQVIAGAVCAAIPAPTKALATTCDHLEQSVLPAETLGKSYLVAAPTGPLGAPAPFRARIFGNVDGTTLTFPAGAPAGAPKTVDAGGVADLGTLTESFEVVADHEVAIALFMLSAQVAEPDDLLHQGDPSQSQAVALEQYRTTYAFLAPVDYDVTFVDVIEPMGATVTLDGAAFPSSPTPVGSSGYGVARARLGGGAQGAHTIHSDLPIGVQVLGYGAFTSYMYPAGLDLVRIAQPPPLK